MQHSTYQDTTFCTMPYSTSHISITFHIAPFLKLLHSTSHHISHTPHHISHHTIIHIKSLPHLGTPFRIMPTFHLTPCHAHHTIPHHTFKTTTHIPHCISTIIPHHTMSDMASTYSTSLYSTTTSVLHNGTPPYSPCTTPSFHITSPHFIHNYSISHPHSTPQHIWHHTIFHITLHHHIFTSYHIWHNTLHHFPHLTSHNNRTAHCICHIFHHHNSTPPYHNFQHLALYNIPQTRTQHSTPWYIPHHTFCISITFHITPCLKLQHSTSHHISHRTIIHTKLLHHITAHHSTSCPHSTSNHAMLFTTFKCKLHITLSPSTHSKPHHNIWCDLKCGVEYKEWGVMWNIMGCIARCGVMHNVADTVRFEIWYCKVE